MADETITDQDPISALADADVLAVDDASDTNITKKVSGIQIKTYVSNAMIEETPGGTQDGANKVFTIVNTPLSGTVFSLYNNGNRREDPGDYSLSGTTITFVIAPVVADKIRVVYFI